MYTYLYENNFVLPSAVIADAGCGTGFSSELFLKHHHKVFGIEPNKNMLGAAINYLDKYKNFVPLQTSAENTTLQNASVDVITCAQTFHWLDKEKVKTEFKRILKPGGTVVLMWNDRQIASKRFFKSLRRFFTNVWNRLQRSGS